MEAPRKINVRNYELSKVQDNVLSTLRKLTKTTFADALQIDNVSLTTAETLVAHTLGRKPQGWLVVDQDGPGVVYRTAWDSRNITLRLSSGSATISLVVY